VIQLVQVARSIRIRLGLITAPFRVPFHIFGPRVKEFRVTSSMPPSPAPVAESVQEWLRRAGELRGRSLHRRMLIGKPNA
jgi:hypothetical protein